MADITLYALSTCVHCKHAKEYLEEHNQEYDCIYVDRLSGEERNETIRTVKKFNPNLSFPTVVIGDDVIVGFKKEAIDQALEGQS